MLGAEILRTEDRSFALSDDVMCLRNAKRLGVLNGTRGTVVGFDADGLHIETTGGPRVLPTRYIEAGHLDPRLRHHRAQGPGCHLRPGIRAGYRLAHPRGRIRGHEPGPQREPSCS